MQMCVLASGSSGNCTVVRLGGRTILIDAGIGPRAIARRLAGTGIRTTDLSALLLTHLDSDHFKPTWLAVISDLGIEVHLHRRHLHAFYRIDETAARRLQQLGLLIVFDDQPFTLAVPDGPPAVIRTVHCRHDREGTVSYRIRAETGCLTFTTDVGCVTDELIDAMIDTDLLAIESNYDPPMQLASARPAYLKRRIMGGRGHLSNAEAAEAVRRAVGRSARPPEHIVLLHLSRQCNHPAAARSAFSAHPELAGRLCITSQFEPSQWLRVNRATEPLIGEQLLMW